MIIRKKLTGLILASLCFNGTLVLADDLTWNGAVDNVWNTTTANWINAAANPTTYNNGDNVIFSGTSGEITDIVSRSPSSTTVDSNNKVTFATGILNSNLKVIGGPSILSGSLVKNGTGELELGDPGLGQQFGAAADRNKYSNSFTSVTVNAGTLRFRARAALGTGTVTLADGVKVIQASEEGRFNTSNEHIDNNFHLAGGTVEFPMAFGDDNKGIWIRNGIVSGPGGIKVTGSDRSLAMSSNNTFMGGVTLEAGGGSSVTIAAYEALGSGTFTASQSASGSGGLAAGTDLSGNASYPDGVANPVVITSGDFFNVRCTSAGATMRLGGDISGDGTLCKWSNDSTVILSGNNSYSGGTIISDGTLVCESADSLGGGPLTIASGALIQLDFIDTVNVSALTIGGSSMPNGTYGSSSSPADNRDDNYFAGSGIINVGPPKTATTTALAQTGGTNPIDIGLPVTFTATVSGGAVTGTVAFYDGLNFIGSSALDGFYQAEITTSALPQGTRNILAQYEGDGTFAASTSSSYALTVVDDRPASAASFALTSGTNPSSYGSPVTYTVTVTGASPTGQVTFYDRDEVIGVVDIDGASQASITVFNLIPGSRRITAEYGGDSGNAPSTQVFDQVVEPRAGNGKLKVFILAGQSNMQGHGKVELGRDPEDINGALIEGGIGSLRNATTRDPKKFDYLLDPDNPVNGQPGWTTRDDVWISFWGNDGLTVERRAGYLDPGFGVGASLADERIGPEYGFGQAVGAGLADDVLIIKTAWGGKSLYVDFRPPSSGGTTGPYYLSMIEKVHEVLNNLTTYYPDYNGNGYELVGFGWHQGWNDRIDGPATAEYETNLANLIRDVRTEFGVPGLPFVIANSGLADAPSGPGTLLEAQGNVADPILYPEFAGKVTTVDTRPFDYGEFQGTSNQGYHWWGNGESYLNIGVSMAEAILALQPSPFKTWAGGAGQGLTAGVNDGPLDDPDFDGIVNLMEFVLNSNPMVPSPGQLPVGTAPSAGSWHFEYHRNKESVPGVTQIVEYTTDFATWTQVAIPATTAGTVTVTPGTNTDHVSVAIPVIGTAGFARLVISE